MTKIDGLDIDVVFNDLVTDLETRFASDRQYTDILDWYDNGGVDKDDLGIELTEQQRLILATYYGLPLTDEQLSILEFWSAEERTTYDFDFGPTRRSNLVLECGRRGGKSLLGSLIINYEFELLCRMPSPQRHYGIASSTLISIICVAPSAEQVVKTIYGQARAMMYNCPFLKRLIDAKKIEVQEKQIKYEEKLLYIYSGNSKSETQVGGSPILIVLDEGALFEDKDGQSNALTLWDNLGAGGLVFGADAKRCIISSAWKPGDALITLYSAAKESQVWLAFRLKSWQLNPKFASRDNPVIDSMYISNRKMAELLYEGLRSSGVDNFFEPDAVKASFDHMSTLYAVEEPITDDKLIRLHIKQLEPFEGQTIMHLDPAVVHDAYALAFGHSYMDAGELHVVIDGIMAWKPKEGCHVSIINVQKCIHEIHTIRPLYRVTSDPKESSETLQRLKMSGISTALINFSNPKQLAMYDVVRKLANEGRLHLPKNSPWTSMLKDELLSLELKQTKVTGQAKIDHPVSSSKDIADCVAAVCYQLGADSFENTFKTIKSFSVTTNDQSAVIADADDQYSFNKTDFVRGLKGRKKGWSGLSNLSRIV